MKDLFKYFKGYIKESLLGPLFKLLEASFELLVPILIARIVDQTIPKKIVCIFIPWSFCWLS